MCAEKEITAKLAAEIPTMAEKPKAEETSPPVHRTKMHSASPLRFRLQCVYLLVLILTTAWTINNLEGSIYFGRSRLHVFWYGWVSAVCTGLGALPLIALDNVDQWWIGIANAGAAGMMTAASFFLIAEGFELEPDQMPISVGARVLLGSAIGCLFIWLSKGFLEEHEEVTMDLLCMDKLNATKALIIVTVMTLHSFSEGVGIGVSFGGNAGSQLGVLVTCTLAIHNVPEGFAVSVVLVSRGMSVLGAALWSVTTSLPQPLMALLANMFIDQFVPVLPVGLGFAGGAMLWVAWGELVPDAIKETSLTCTGCAGAISAATMWAFQHWLHDHM